jgi:LmbE family N-acetylglucosaminyl deacetylase
VQPQAVITMPPHGLSGHTDHVAVSHWTTLACQRAIETELVAQLALYYLAVPQSVADRLGLGQLRATPDAQIAVTVDVGPVWEAKMTAIRCHATQLGESPILRAPLERQRLFLGTEHLERAAGPAGAPDVLSGWGRQVA